MNYLIMRLVIVGFINLFIYFVDGHVGDSKQSGIVFSVDLDALYD